MKTLRYLGVVLFGVLLLFVLAAKFSTVETRYRCDATLMSNGNAEDLTVYLKLERYRWWVGLWSNSDGTLWMETPNQGTDYFGHLVEVGDQIQIHVSPDTLRGQFSLLSKALSVVTLRGHIEGSCAPIAA